MSAQNLKIFIPSGNPYGMKIITLGNWSGKIFVVPRPTLKELKERSEASQPGIYFLFGVDEELAQELVYIGESESFYGRMTSHDGAKDFWNRAVIFTGGLNRALVKYLEYKSTSLAKEVRRMVVKNTTQPQVNTLDECDKAEADQYFETMKFLLEAIGYDIFDKAEDSYMDGISYQLKADGAFAKAKVLDDGAILVAKGALARKKEAPSFSGWSKAARERFVKEGILVDSTKHAGSYELMQDTVFKSPSAAAATLTGTSVNGWILWKDEKGRTLDENLRN